MADDVRRWSVTYTKHIKQKRKVYQDGFLELHSSSHKVKLYDDCDKLLDSKILKLDDAVRAGETLAFGAYLIDVGDPHGENKPIPNLISQRRDKIITDKDSMPNNNVSKGSSHICKASSIKLSPSQKIIREFKRREENKYHSSPSCPNKVKDDSTEWQVLYTTQLTQKSKKFHDGILRVATSGLRGRQATLYDETRKLLDNKFLRNEEIVRVGESLRFDGHIVDIIELRDHKPLKDTNIYERNCYKQNTVQLKIHNEHLTEFDKRETNKPSISTKTNLTEWDVMYTTQITQRAKKFHDGVLKLATCGSQGRQEATLLSEDGTVLSHKYLKLLEDINTGSLFNMPNYLVEVGEPRKHSEENETPKIRTFDADNVILSKRIPATKSLSNEPPKRALSLQDTDKKGRNSVADKVISMAINKKPLRDAHSILSILKKPSSQECDATGKVHLEELHPVQDSAFVQTNIQNHVEKQQDSCTTRSDLAVCDEETRKIREYRESISNCKSIDDIMVDKQENDTEYVYSIGLETSVTKRSFCDVEFSTIKNKHSSPIEEPRVMETLCMNINSLPSTAAETRCESTETVDVVGHPDVMSSKATSTSKFSEPAKETINQSKTEISCGNKMIHSNMHGGNIGSGPRTSCNHHDISNDVREDFKNTNSTNADFPSFDLGFD